ncbi:hypothetical protein AYJ58_01065 [Shewanella sp. Pdp11]|uniref:hypothetical protein n=1 Tax=Shewanella sp. Pdp11 TaxID=2059264 RepID=UPI000CA11370|nr:hypothetical protein [Shewanella sp. Pdp11]AUD58165.1 hypothetical protein AYJ58_01065 [Shewanella sp. Pdp11]EGT3626741.1 hypothetical protein [Morganella morganii]
MYQHKYWNQLKELKVHVYYVQAYAVKQNKYDQIINIFLAITSSSSIAAWALWKDYQFLWAFIIAASQVITAIKPLLPYRKRLSALNKLGDMLSLISLKAERDWYFVAEGKWSEEEIHSKWADLKEDALSAENKCLNGVTLPKNKSALTLAEKEADIYLQSTYY